MHNEKASGPLPEARRREARYLQVAARMLAALHADPSGPFVRRPPAGTMRGIDFYPASRLVVALARSLALYERAHGRLPNLLHPASMTEKLVWAKFFSPVPTPSPGDKLGLAHYVPRSLRGRVELPAPVWVGDEARLPPNDAVPPGDYFLKASHGSGFLRELRYPLSAEERERAQTDAARWLGVDYGTAWGEWWYSPVRRRLLLEPRLGESGEDVPDWKLWVIGGRVRLLHVVRDRKGANSMAHFTRDFDFMPVGRADHAPGGPIERPAQLDALIEAAESIGRMFCCARVDFYLPDERRIVLGEITLCPNNALIVYRPLEFDFWLGKPWDVHAPPLASPGQDPSAADGLISS